MIELLEHAGNSDGMFEVAFKNWNEIYKISFPCRIEQSPDTNKDELDSAEDTDGGKIDNEEVNFRVHSLNRFC